jgi:ubiquinone/menaquinone biosynthesis C-methylase UbiE
LQSGGRSGTYILMDASGSLQANREYYDAFSERYEARRGINDPGGYHEFLDELESSFVQRFAHGRDVLEVGCGTGLVLQRIAGFARSARGIDLSPGMLERARARGLDVVLGSATELPFDAETFDVTCSFKVLAHIPDVHGVLSEMARVTRPGGYVLAEFYNPWSVRGLVKRFGPAGAIAAGKDESHVYTRLDSPRQVRELTPRGCRFTTARGVRIVTPTAHAMRVPGLRTLLRGAERALCDSPLSAFGGFFVAAFVKEVPWR